MLNINTVGGYLHSQSPRYLFVVIHRSEKKQKSLLKLKDNLRSSRLDLGADHAQPPQTKKKEKEKRKRPK